MPTVIKATDRNAGIHGVAYNFTDMAVEADRRLGKFNDQAVAIIEKAKQEAQQIKQQAQAAGRQAAAEEIGKQLQQQLATLMPAMRQTVQEIQHSKQAWLAHWEKSGVHLATAIAERLIRKHLPESPELTLTLVREALELAAGSARIRVHLNPADHKTLGAQVESIAKELSGLAPTELIPNENISPGGARVETEFGIIDQQFESQLARIEEELT